jgi:hypothetical protein
MAARFTELVVDCHDPHRLARFWADVLGYDVRPAEDADVEVVGPAGSGPSLLFEVDEARKQVKNRLHIDVTPTDRTLAEEVDRLLALGATRADIGQGDVSWVVLADPEGNEFCVLDGLVEPL